MMQADDVDDLIGEHPGHGASGGSSGADVEPRDADAVERLLDELQRESERRRADLRALAAQLPEATSRRALVRSMVSSVVHAPNRPLVAKRVVLKLARTPADLFRRWRTR